MQHIGQELFTAREKRLMLTEPKLEDRGARPYLGIRVRVTMKEMETELIPRLLGEVFAWLEQQGVAPAGAPFVRFHVIDMESTLDIELGVPVLIPMSGEGRIHAGVLPAGRYAALVYTGGENGVRANRALLDWGADQGLVWDTYEARGGDGFGARYETFLTGPEDEPDPANWDTEVAIRLRPLP